MYKGHVNRTAFTKAQVAQSVEHQTINLKVVGPSHTFHFVFCRLPRASGSSIDLIQMKPTDMLEISLVWDQSICSIQALHPRLKMQRKNEHLKKNGSGTSSLYTIA